VLIWKLEVADTSTNTCPKVYGVSHVPVQTQRGSGTGDGIYVHSSSAKGVVTTFTRAQDSNGFFFTNIFGGTDALLEHTIDGNGNVQYRIFNNNSGGWT
jgi:hypothetical protein